MHMERGALMIFFLQDTKTQWFEVGDGLEESMGVKVIGQRIGRDDNKD